MALTASEISLPESDLRSNSHNEQRSMQYQQSAKSYYPDCDSSSSASVLPEHPFSGLDNGYNVPSAAVFDPSFPSITNDYDFAAAFANFQSCNDCTSTSIPHHHHPSGRLAGASATLDGHFCCSWLVHGQPCFLCFESARALDEHIKNDHAGKDGAYQCLWQNCSKHDPTSNTAGVMNFGNKPKLMRHVHSHTGYKPFCCPYPGCDKGFVTKEQLRNHETTHTKSRKYKCDQCGKAFAVKSALTTHITAVHDEKKIHSCEICGKAFADSSNLSKHKQTHYREPTVKRRRNTRDTSSAASNRSSPSISTASIETVTPIMGVARLHNFPTSGSMAPPSVPKLPATNLYPDVPITYSTVKTLSTTSSPPPETFDPECYCCDQHCPLPEGAATPCDEPDDCDLEGFCCDERCTPPNGLAAPCLETEDCDLEGFCNLPNCLSQQDHSIGPLLHHQIEQLRNFEMPERWGEPVQDHNHSSQRSLSHFELEDQLTNMHGS